MTEIVAVTKVKIDGYKAFFVYVGIHINVFVNSQKQFEAGQKDVAGNGTTLSEEQAEQARTMDAFEATHTLSFAEDYRKHLKVNGFDLEEE